MKQKVKKNSFILNCKMQFQSLIIIPRDKMKPPNAKSVSSANDPKVLATIMFLPAAAINRNNADAIWLISKSSKYCLKSLEKNITLIYQLDQNGFSYKFKKK
jgi:hypothetical protein